jgi:hypothetical protein
MTRRDFEAVTGATANETIVSGTSTDCTDFCMGKSLAQFVNLYTLSSMDFGERFALLLHPAVQ